MNTKLKGEAYLSNPIESVKRAADQWIKNNLGVSIGLIGTLFGAFLLPLIILIAIAGVNLANAQENGVPTIDVGFITLTALIGVVVIIGLVVPLAIAIDYAFVSSQNDTKVSYKAAIKRGFKRVFPALGAYILAGLAILGGLILLIVPGIWLALRLSYLNSVVAYENLGPVATVKRAFSLTKGNLWDIVGVASVSVIVSSLISIVMNILGMSANDNVFTALLTILLGLASVAAGLYLAQALYFRYHQSALEKTGELKKEGTDKLNYYLFAAALIVGGLDGATTPEQSSPTDFRLEDFNGTV